MINLGFFQRYFVNRAPRYVMTSKGAASIVYAAIGKKSSQ